jgi:hypothetical protein
VGEEAGEVGAHEVVVDGELAELEGETVVGPGLAVEEVEEAPGVGGVDAGDGVGGAVRLAKSASVCWFSIQKSWA